jgi:hypothetical protein
LGNFLQIADTHGDNLADKDQAWHIECQRMKTGGFVVNIFIAPPAL